MKNYIYKLKFFTSVRFGSDKAGGGLVQSGISCHADTLFSALAWEWINIFGPEDFAGLLDAAQKGLFLISDMFPWSGLELYLPKPALLPFFKKEMDKDSRVNKKALKNLAYLPVGRFREYLNFLSSGEDFLLQAEEDGWAGEVLFSRTSIGRSEKTSPYLVSARRFREDSGLYFILRTTEEWREKTDLVMESLALSGIGGKRSSGLGKFQLAEESFENGLYDSDCLLEEMMEEEGGIYMSLSVLAPSNDELAMLEEGEAYYTLVGRTGFVVSPDYAPVPMKRKPVVMFNAGSCFAGKIKGQILEVSEAGGHPVYRYGKGMYLGVKI